MSESVSQSVNQPVSVSVSRNTPKVWYTNASKYRVCCEILTSLEKLRSRMSDDGLQLTLVLVPLYIRVCRALSSPLHVWLVVSDYARFASNLSLGVLVTFPFT